MKKHIPTTAILLLSTLDTLAQGYINFNTRVSGTVVAHVYGSVGFEFWKTGNTASETPAGTQIYLGPRLEGSGFSAELWAAGGSGPPEGSLVRVPGSLTTFRTGAILGGTPAPLNLQVPNVAIHGTGTFQVRAWDNMNGTIPSYADAISYGRLLGKSDLFDVSNLGDGVLDFPADMADFRSFNIFRPPEPSTSALLGLGALGLWLFRRKKNPC